MKQFVFCSLLCLGLTGTAATAQQLYLAPDVPSDPDGAFLFPSDVIRVDPPSASPYTKIQSVAGNPQLSALHKMDAPSSWLFAVEAPNDLAGQITAPVAGAFAEPRDVISDDGSGSYTKFLCGGALSDPLAAGVGIDAVYLAGGDLADLIVSFDTPVELPSGSGTVRDAADLLRFSRTDPADCADWMLAGQELDASAAGIPAQANVVGADRVAGDLILSLDVPTDLTTTCSASSTCTPGQIVALSGGSFALFEDLQVVGSPGWSIASQVRALSCESNPGTVFDASALPTGIELEKASGTMITLAWPNGSCSSGALDYGIYEGSLTALGSGAYDHVGLDCSDAGGDLKETITPSSGDRYYLVVPQNGKVEGSYSADSSGGLRPQPTLPADRCVVERVVTACP